MADNSFSESLNGLTIGLSDMFVNLSAEYPDLLTAIFIVFGAVGIIISGTAIFDIIKLGDNSGGQRAGGGAIFSKLLGGSMMVDLSFWAAAFADSLWSYSSPLGIESYTASSASGDMAETAMMAVLGFIVLAGYVVIGRAYLMITRLGYLTPDARSELIGSIIARIAAGTAMIACLHIARAIEESTKFNFLPT